MGACGSKNKKATEAVVQQPVLQQKAPDPDDDKSDDDMMDGLAESFHDPAKTARQKMAWHRENVHMEEVYQVVKLIGQGSMGEVLSVKKKPSNNSATNSTVARSERLYAAKTINTTRFKKSEVKEFINEIDILRDLDHPNIIHMYEVFSTKRKIWIITELCTGGDLGERARSTQTGMTEYEVADVIEQILRALCYMHKRGVCHRDLKFENIMYVDASCGSPLKLIDFGLSNKFNKGEKMEEVCGTLYTLAPEMLSTEGYTEQADIWSVGCLAFILQSNQYPFLQEPHELDDRVKRSALENAQYEFGAGWRHKRISEKGKDFVRHCLKKDPDERYTGPQALEYVQEVWLPFLEEMEDQKSEGISMASSVESDERNKMLRDKVSRRKFARMDSKDVEGMQAYASYGEFKKRILVTMAYTMDKQSVEELRHIFLSCDTNNSGTITYSELKDALAKMNSEKHFDEETIDTLFKGIDVDNSGNIHYAEFIAAILESQGLITMERLADAFERLDSEGKGYISKENLRALLGVDYNSELVDKMIEEADFKKNGKVDYEEFLQLMFGHDPASGFKNLGKSEINIDSEKVKKLAAVGVDKELAESLVAAEQEADKEPSPALAAVLEEGAEELVKGQDDDQERAITEDISVVKALSTDSEQIEVSPSKRHLLVEKSDSEERSESPAKDELSPVKEDLSPANDNSSPVKDISSPAKNTSSPVKDTSSPAREESSPSKEDA